jgi:hypothetical protein
MIKNDISFWLSGGKKNSKADNSLGGPISIYQIEDNLFNDVTFQEAITGSVANRCFYIKNNSKKEILKDLTLSIDETSSDAIIELGVMFRGEIQGIIVNGKPDRGFFQILYLLKQGGHTYTAITRQINWNTNSSQVADNIAAALNSSDNIEGVKCVGSESGSGFDFIVTFRHGRQQELLGVINEIGVDMSVMRVQAGGPINSVAPNIGFENNTPNGVKFYKTSSSDPLKIGDLYPHDIMPVWFRRTISPNAKSKHVTFSFNVLGNTTLTSNKPHSLDTI